MVLPCIQINMQSHWELLQRGIYRRDNTLELYYEVERLGAELQKANQKIAELTAPAPVEV